MKSTGPPPPPSGEPDFGGSPAPLYSIYSKMKEEDDIKMAKRWQKDAQGIILFVCSHDCLQATQRAN